MKVPTLYHGSPFRLAHLSPRIPRGETVFQTQKAVFLSSNKLEAQLYSLARDTERKNKGWGIHDGVLHLRRDLWTGPSPKYQLNPKGYLHVFTGLKEDNVRQNPDLLTEWVSLEAVKPTRIEEVCLCDLPSTAIQYYEKTSRGGSRRHKKTRKQVRKQSRKAKN
jgi:hypothetical protein